MTSIGSRTGLFSAALIAAVMGLNGSLAEAQSQPNRVLIECVVPEDRSLQDVYDLLRGRRALEKIQEILSPFRSPEELTIKTAECKEVNSWYRRQNFKPTVTICYEFLKRILESLPSASSLC